MGPQDGVEYLVEAASVLVNGRKHEDIQFTLIGGGDMLESLKKLATQRGLEKFMNFTGRIPNDELVKILSTADICAAPDPVGPLNDASTMNKILEYMAMGKPIVSFNLTESRYSADKAAIYADDNDIEDFASRIEKLLPNEELRREMGAFGRKRLEEELSWEFSKKNLLELYRSIVNDE
jgi:glycosyltransferase involved in cell wall biosynthesis